MNKHYINLVKTIYNQKKFTLEPLGLEFRKLNAEGLAAWLYPVLAFPQSKTKPYIFPINKKSLLKAYTLFYLYKQKKYMRVALYGGEYKKTYETLLNTELVYEDDYNKTIIGKGEIYVTVKCKQDILFELLNKFNVFYTIFKFNSLFFDNGIIKTERAGSSSGKYDFKTGQFQIGRWSPHTCLLIIHSLGFTLNEFNFVMLLSKFPKGEHKLMLEKSHTINVQRRVFTHEYN